MALTELQRVFVSSVDRGFESIEGGLSLVNIGSVPIIAHETRRWAYLMRTIPEGGIADAHDGVVKPFHLPTTHL